MLRKPKRMRESRAKKNRKQRAVARVTAAMMTVVDETP
jgi:hypothetical protein